MADLAQVEQCLVAAITQAIYPNGTAHPSVAGADVIIYRGWPIPGNLDRDLAAGKINVSVFPLDIEQRTSRYPRDWYVLAEPVNTLTLTASGNTLTIGGIPSSPLNVAAFVDSISYVYPVQPADQLADIATGLAALINVDNAAKSSGPVVTVAGPHVLRGVTGGFGTMQREIKRQKRSFLLSFWCPDPESRDAIVPPVDAALAGTDFLSLPDGTAGRLLYERSPISDRSEKESAYRRNLIYSVEYATTETQGAAQIVAIDYQFTDQNGRPILSPGNLLLGEDGQAILNETGQRITLPRPHLTDDTGNAILTEDGQRILLG